MSDTKPGCALYRSLMEADAIPVNPALIDGNPSKDIYLVTVCQSIVNQSKEIRHYRFQGQRIPDNVVNLARAFLEEASKNAPKGFPLLQPAGRLFQYIAPSHFVAEIASEPTLKDVFAISKLMTAETEPKEEDRGKDESYYGASPISLEEIPREARTRHRVRGGGPRFEFTNMAAQPADPIARNIAEEVLAAAVPPPPTVGPAVRVTVPPR